MGAIVRYWPIALFVLMFLWALTDPRPRYDRTRRSKRHAQRNYWR